ncbi:hypothetical protein Y025_5726 [Burkholderia pseudomallei TSV32]|nr:hypothetical protein Y025_5726 [Burkholderia pseudomallei TSV32]
MRACVGNAAVALCRRRLLHPDNMTEGAPKSSKVRIFGTRKIRKR